LLRLIIDLSGWGVIMSLEDLRKKIDQIDTKILKLLSERAKVTLEVGKDKRRRKSSFYVPAREKEIIQRMLKENPGPLSDFALKVIFKEIFSACRTLEKPLKIAYLGPPATFTHMACLERFGSQVICTPQESIPDVFHYVGKKDADYGVVPIENSTEGIISHTLDMFIYSNLKICSEIYLNVSHHLLSKVKLKEVTKVYSNPQAFAQTRLWLRDNLSSQVDLIETSSTTKAAQLAAKERQSAAIASKLAAEVYNLSIIAENIEDNPANRTRFLVIGHTEGERSGQDKTSIMFSTRHQAGALYRALSPLDKYKVNMTMIESRPTGQKLWEYVFFIDLQGHVGEARLSKALKMMEEECLFVKVLGSYPEAD